MIIWCVFFFFKQKTAYEMRISDWSSDVCSSDLRPELGGGHAGAAHDALALDPERRGDDRDRADPPRAALFKEQRNVEADGGAGAVPREETLLRADVRGMDHRPERRQVVRVGAPNVGREAGRDRRCKYV